MPEDQKKVAYDADITYATNNEFGFDYLRDNMKSDLAQVLQRDHFFAIVDEVDSILIDEARTPLIISGPSDDRSELYIAIDKLIPELQREHFDLDEKQRTATLTEEGNEFVEGRLHEMGHLEEGTTLYDPESTNVVHHVNQALRAHVLFHRDKDYIVRNGEVMLIDEFTGRMMQGRRLSEGLHQAIEAKEGVGIRPENVTLASVTFQNYFRLYEKLAGMTGTAATEADEFFEIYKLGVVEVPTNMPVIRKDHDDQVFRTAREKYELIVEEIKRAHEAGQPILVGTTSIEKSETLSEMLKKAKVPHNVLNARYHEQEASIVAEAGVPGAVTIATNMAGRGTDIQLGGNVDMRVVTELETAEKEGRQADPAELRARVEAEVAERKARVIEAGGLYVLATERHESRRIDNQLRGRSGRQGDPGRTNFYLSLEDDLMRIFGSDRLDFHARQARHEGRRGHRPPVGQQGARKGPGKGRGAQLRHPQEPAQVRRRDERPAQGRLRPAPGDHGGRRPLRGGHRHAPAGHRRPRRPSTSPPRPMPTSGTSRASPRRFARSSASTCRSSHGPTRRASTTRTSASA